MALPKAERGFELSTTDMRVVTIRIPHGDGADLIRITATPDGPGAVSLWDVALGARHIDALVDALQQAKAHAWPRLSVGLKQASGLFYVDASCRKSGRPNELGKVAPDVVLSAAAASPVDADAFFQVIASGGGEPMRLTLSIEE